MNEKLGFLILHYKVIDETIKCIESIKRNVAWNLCEIVVVDNGSLNNTGEKLADLYKNENNVKIIILKNNLGFAKGNNVGFQCLLKELGCSFICMLNNDTEILQKNFYDLVMEEYKESFCAVIGPKIILNNNKVQKLYSKKVTIESITNDIKYMKKQLFYNRIHMIKVANAINSFLDRLRNLKREVAMEKTDQEDVRVEGIVLRGCCLIFTPRYTEKFDGINDCTYMYREEEFLYLRLTENNMKSVYNPNIVIRHYEDVSTDFVYDKLNEKIKFQFENDIKSSELLIRELQRLSDEKMIEDKDISGIFSR